MAGIPNSDSHRTTKVMQRSYIVNEGRGFNPIILMNRQEWYQNPANQAGLIDALANPFLVSAMGIIRKESEPRTTQLTETNVTVALARFHEAAGKFCVMDELESLSRPETRRKKEPVKPVSLIEEVIQSHIDKPKA